MSMHQDNCPTCGVRLEALARAELRLCQGCRRQNPAGFLYCGYCATPMEDDELRVRSAEVAAPEGGWPNLEAELVEVRFFLAQGQLDEAYDHLSTLQARHPGHPELADFALSASERRSPEPDEDVETLVDSVLADSSTLGGKALRRRAVPWDAPTSEPVVRRGRKLTTAHEVVQLALAEEFFDDDDDEPATLPRAKVVVADYAKHQRPARKMVPKVERTNVFDAVPPNAPPKPVQRIKLRKPPVRHPPAAPQAAVAKVKPVKRSLPRPSAPAGPSAKMPPVRATGPAKPEAKPAPRTRAKPAAQPQHTTVVEALQPAAPFGDEAKHTMAVDALQPAMPFEGEAPAAFEARKEQIKRATSKTGRRRRVAPSGKGKDSRKRDRYLAAAKKVAEQSAEQNAEQDGDEGEAPSKARGTAFGAGILARFGR